jgi:iron complex outermembrane receptor protein
MDNKQRSFSDTIVAETSVQAIVDGLRAEAGLKFNRSEVFIGADFDHTYKDGQRIKTAILQPTMPVFTEQIWNDAVIVNLGGFIEYRRETQFASLMGTLRLDYNQANSDDILIEKMNNVIYFNDDTYSEYLNLSFSLGANKQLNDNWALGLMLGRGVRSPDMTERYITLLPVGYDWYDYLGNPKLKPEINYEIDLTTRFFNEKWGQAELNGFYSYAIDFISGEIIPPSEQKPLTKDVLGVKKFENLEPVHFTGFEFVYHSPTHYRWGINVIASYTRATVESVTKYILNDNNEVTGTEEVKNDPLPEVPPFESTINLFYKLLKSRFIPKMSFRIVASQNYVSQAYYEDFTPGFVVAGLDFSYKYNQTFTVNGGIKNLFNNAYYEHLNRRIIGSVDNLMEPGVNFYLNLIIKI